LKAKANRYHTIYTSPDLTGRLYSGRKTRSDGNMVSIFNSMEHSVVLTWSFRTLGYSK